MSFNRTSVKFHETFGRQSYLTTLLRQPVASFARCIGLTRIHTPQLRQRRQHCCHTYNPHTRIRCPSPGTFNNQLSPQVVCAQYIQQRRMSQTLTFAAFFRVLFDIQMDRWPQQCPVRHTLGAYSTKKRRLQQPTNCTRDTHPDVNLSSPLNRRRQCHEQMVSTAKNRFCLLTVSGVAIQIRESTGYVHMAHFHFPNHATANDSQTA